MGCDTSAGWVCGNGRGAIDWQALFGRGQAGWGAGIMTGWGAGVQAICGGHGVGGGGQTGFGL